MTTADAWTRQYVTEIVLILRPFLVHLLMMEIKLIQSTQKHFPIALHTVLVVVIAMQSVIMQALKIATFTIVSQRLAATQTKIKQLHSRLTSFRLNEQLNEHLTEHFKTTKTRCATQFVFF